LLGKDWKKEYALATGPVKPNRLDVVWFDSPGLIGISHAFEVQNRGDAQNAIDNLLTAQKYYPQCRLFMVVVNQREIEAIKAQLSARKAEAIVVVRSSDVEKWLGALRQKSKNLENLVPVFQQLAKIGLMQ
jgi:hypothetical protein